MFVSAELGEKEAARAAFKFFGDLGVRVTHDWTTTDDLVDKVAQPEEAGRRAAADIAGVVDADIYVLLSDNYNPGKGMYVELGAALALRQKFGVPEVFIVGQMNHLSIFYLHPEVVHCRDLDELEAHVRPHLTCEHCASTGRDRSLAR